MDACLLVTEAGTKISKADEELAARFKSIGLPAVLAINKIDLLEDKSLLMQQIEALSKLYDFDAVVPVSAKDGNGMDALKDELSRLAQPGGHFFAEDTLTDQPERVIAAEIVREKIPRHVVTLVAGGLTLVVVFLLTMHSWPDVWQALSFHSMAETTFWYTGAHGSTGMNTGINWSTILFITGMMILVEG